MPLEKRGIVTDLPYSKIYFVNTHGIWLLHQQQPLFSYQVSIQELPAEGCMWRMFVEGLLFYGFGIHGVDAVSHFLSLWDK
jgi:hypothetical protein